MKSKINIAMSPFWGGIGVVVVACLFFVSFGQQKPLFLQSLDNRTFDMMFRWRGVEQVTGQVVIVDIDEKSLQQLGQWPWPRRIIADLIDRINQAAPKAIGLDVVFAEEDRASPARFVDDFKQYFPDTTRQELVGSLKKSEAFNYDLLLGQAVARAPVVLGYVFQLTDDGLKKEGETPFPSASLTVLPADAGFADLALFSAYRPILNTSEVAQAETEGFFNVALDPSGIVRRVPLLMACDGIPYPSLALEVVRLGDHQERIVIQAARQKVAGGRGVLGISLGDWYLPTDSLGQVTVNYRGDTGTFDYVSAVDVLAGRAGTILAGKYVLIGTSAKGLLDLRATPFVGDMPGVEVHATVIDNILANDLFTYDLFTESGLTVTVILLAGLIVAGLCSWAPPLIGAIVGFSIPVMIVAGNYYFFFLQKKMIGMVFPLVAVTLVFVVVTLCNYFFEGRAKRYVQNAFSHYVSPHLVNQLVRQPEKLRLSGEEKEVTIFFSDIRGFTTISEGMGPQQLGAFMNEYLTAMSTIVMECGGTVDKYIGDAVMAIWGAPLDDPEHAVKAVHASLLMLERLEALQPVWQERGLPLIDIGIGLNTGLVSVGNFGSEQRFDYTVLGDNVNLASRLEGSNKTYGTNIIISEYTREAIGDRFFCRCIDLVRVKGKKLPVHLYEPLCEGIPGKSLREATETYEGAINAYRNRRFDEAADIFEGLAAQKNSRLYQLYLERIRTFGGTPPADDWDGVFTFTTK